MKSAGDAAVIGVDVGSNASRAGVFSASGKLLARAESPFDVHRPRSGHAEHDSTQIWRAVTQSVRAALRHSGVEAAAVRGLAFDATCSLALFDGAGAPVSVSVTGEDRWNVVMWADHRAKTEAEEITAGGHRVLDYVGGVMSPEMEMPKLLWLKRHLPQSWSRYGIALDLTDFLTWRATGRRAVSSCTVTCKWTYLAHEKEGWQRDFLAAIGLAELIEKLALPGEVCAIGTAAGPLAPAAAVELGLTTDCVVGVGLIDAHAGGIGLLGGMRTEDADSHIAMIAGTSTCHMAVSPGPRRIHGVWGPYFGAMLPGLWLNEAGQSATGSLLQHLLDWHAAGLAIAGDRHAAVTALVQARLAADGPGFAGELQVLPDFHGNRSPLAEPDALGVIHGLALESDLESLVQLYYATCVGIALGTRHIADALNAHGYSVSTLHLTGGHASNPLLVRLYADATGCTVVLPEEPDGVLLGTACVAATAAGLQRSLADAGAAMVRAGQRIAPDPRLRDHFDRRYRSFLLMQEHRRAISALVRAVPATAQ